MVALYDRPWTAKPGNNNTISRGQSSNHTHYDVINHALLEQMSWCTSASKHVYNSCLIDVFDCLLLLFVCLIVCLFVVVARSHSARVQKTSYENYAPGYVPARDSFRRQGGVRGSGAARKPQNQPPTRQIFVEREASKRLCCGCNHYVIYNCSKNNHRTQSPRGGYRWMPRPLTQRSTLAGSNSNESR